MMNNVVYKKLGATPLATPELGHSRFSKFHSQMQLHFAEVSFPKRNFQDFRYTHLVFDKDKLAGDFCRSIGIEAKNPRLKTIKRLYLQSAGEKKEPV
jgi:hypothetical protein